MAGWRDLTRLVSEEITQRREEGCDVTGFAERFENCRGDAEYMALWHDLQKLQISSDFPYVEPSHLAGIRSASSGESEKTPVALDDKLFDKVHGAWLGRCAGCMLGKPVEGWGWDRIRKYLEFVGEYPMTNYIPPAPEGKDLPEGVSGPPHKVFSRGQFNHGMIDDDTNYTVLNMKIVDEKGPDFTTADMGRFWLQNLPYNHVCTAERQAYINLVNELPIGYVPMYLNPFREWIGAQIRADFFGYCAPGWPEKAAEMGFRDAALSHIKNGIYGEMAAAAMISKAFVTDDVNQVIKAGLDVVPAKSRIADVFADCWKWHKECKTWDEAFAKMLETYYGKYNWVHTNNNLAICILALLYGWPDFEKVLCISVMQGMDTDCNGATVGSMIGAALGAKALPDKWTAPLNGLLETSVMGYSMPKIADLAANTMKLIERVAKA